MFTFTRNRLFALIAIVLAIGGLLGGLAACSGSSGPQNATQILQSDGYTPNAAFTNALSSGLNGGSGEVTSSQAGTNSAGDIQAVVVFDNPADAQAGEQGVAQAGDTGFYTGITPVLHGDVLTLTGPSTAWASLGAS